MVGILTVVFASWWFGVAEAELLATGTPTATDLAAARWCRQHISPAATRCAEVVTFFGSASFLVPAGIVAALLLLRRREWHRAAALVLTVGGGALLNLALKTFFHRDRPDVGQALVHELGYSFPSGHTMGAVLFYGFMAVLVATHAQTRRWQLMAPALALLLIFSIGFSRVYLGAHFLSDVTAAAAASLVWLALCITGVEALRPRQEIRDV